MPESEALKQVEEGKATPSKAAAVTGTAAAEAQATEGPGGEDAASDDNHEEL